MIVENQALCGVSKETLSTKPVAIESICSVWIGIKILARLKHVNIFNPYRDKDSLRHDTLCWCISSSEGASVLLTACIIFEYYLVAKNVSSTFEDVSQTATKLARD